MPNWENPHDTLSAKEVGSYRALGLGYQNKKPFCNLSSVDGYGNIECRYVRAKGQEKKCGLY